MKLNCNNKAKLNISFYFIVILIVITVSMHAVFYGNHDLYSIYDNIVSYEAKALNISEKNSVDEYRVNAAIAYEQDATNGHYISTNISNDETSSLSKADNIPKSFSCFKYIMISDSINYLTSFLVISHIFYSNLFISLPDDWTLVNHMVRLDD